MADPLVVHASELKTQRACELRWVREYVARDPSDRALKTSFSLREAKVGTLVHWAISQATLAAKPGTSVLKRRELVAELDRGPGRGSPSDNSLALAYADDSALVAARQACKGLAFDISTVRRGADGRPLVETPFRHEVAVDGVRVVLEGTVDRVDEGAVVDFKTGGGAMPHDDFAADPQANLYLYVAHRLWGIDRVRFEYVIAGATLEMDWSPDVDALVEYYLRRWLERRTALAVRPQDAAANVGHACLWCPFTGLCEPQETHFTARWKAARGREVVEDKAPADIAAAFAEANDAIDAWSARKSFLGGLLKARLVLDRRDTSIAGGWKIAMRYRSAPRFPAKTKTVEAVAKATGLPVEVVRDGMVVVSDRTIRDIIASTGMTTEQKAAAWEAVKRLGTLDQVEWVEVKKLEDTL